MRKGLLLLTTPFLLAALPASADDKAIAAAISSGAYAQAEQSIRAELRIYPSRPELLLNLAAVYAKTGRDAEARALYTKVLAQREVLMDQRADKVLGSHKIASIGLKRIAAVQMTSR
ncbi:tetratricopeptide repeat protein [Sphingomonas sp.]|jgi:Flp pilus assembly protein TadD|uniref:tetratricopeptide repeat protein n=1 Tax=Sphingomonas sp. TaxID=28214 RepID=UPI002EDB6A94